ncbi:hypothetical protein O3M35_006117 [Rhynocoris fuscipes]|uniref:Uncharacterized protein n=1 Tax=Rhynocoris fuscipes TaxID=488301 RepID=A0AAW1DCB6_9HEMI
MQVSRLRSNHGICKDYLCRIGKLSSSLCDICNEIETLEHIVMQCRRYNAERNAMHCKLKKISHVPLSYSDLLSSNNQLFVEY